MQPKPFGSCPFALCAQWKGKGEALPMDQVSWYTYNLVPMNTTVP
ncbi:MAG: hypothetical protein R2814_14270 [Flavobacteriaceae bacterium]